MEKPSFGHALTMGCAIPGYFLLGQLTIAIADAVTGDRGLAEAFFQPSWVTVALNVVGGVIFAAAVVFVVLRKDRSVEHRPERAAVGADEIEPRPE